MNVNAPGPKTINNPPPPKNTENDKPGPQFNPDSTPPPAVDDFIRSSNALNFQPDGDQELQKVLRPYDMFAGGITLSKAIKDKAKTSSTIETNNGANEKIFARSGDDIINVSKDGHKLIKAGGGDDIIKLNGPGIGNHSIYGGRGNDTVIMDNNLVEDGGPMKVYAEMKRDKDGNVIKDANGEPEYAFLINCVDGYFDHIQGVETIQFANGDKYSAKELYDLTRSEEGKKMGHGTFNDWIEPDKSSSDRGTPKGGGIENILTLRNNNNRPDKGGHGAPS